MNMFSKERAYPTDRHGIRQLDADNKRPRFRIPKTWVSQNNWKGRRIFLSLLSHVETNIATWLEFDLRKIKTPSAQLPPHPSYIDKINIKPGMHVAAFVNNNGKRFIWSPEISNSIINKRDIPEPDFIKFIFKLCIDTQNQYPMSEQLKTILVTKTLTDLK